MKPVIIYIDDNSKSRLLYEDILMDVFGDDYSIVAIPPLPTMQEMSDYIFKQEMLVAIVLDEIMNDSGQASFTGLELANNLRKVLSKIPIYILTSYIDSIEDNDKVIDVELTIAKENIQDTKERRIIAARVRRHLDTLDLIQDQYQKRFQELLEKSLYSELTPEEIVEYKKLDYFRVSKEYAGEIQESQDLKKTLDEQELLLSKIKKQLEEL